MSRNHGLVPITVQQLLASFCKSDGCIAIYDDLVLVEATGIEFGARDNWLNT